MKHITKKKFTDIIKRASQPLKSSNKTKAVKRCVGGSGKKTRLHKSEGTSGKQRGKCR